MRDHSPHRAPFAERLPRQRKRSAGRALAAETPLAVRTTGLDVGAGLPERVRERLGERLGKFALAIERVVVRFEDVNGPRGGVDTSCRIQVVLSGIPSVVVEELAAEPAPAFDRAGNRAERAVRRALDRAGRSAGPAAGRRSARGRAAEAGEPGARSSKRRPLPPPEEGSLIGRRVGRAEANLQRAADRPEKRRRDVPVDTALPGWSATDRRAGGGSTAARNTRLRASGATSALEDSASDRPSRKSTRRSGNRAKRDSNLRIRQTRRARWPKARAGRGGR
jgi:hypothetical protein